MRVVRCATLPVADRSWISPSTEAAAARLPLLLLLVLCGAWPPGPSDAPCTPWPSEDASRSEALAPLLLLDSQGTIAAKGLGPGSGSGGDAGSGGEITEGDVEWSRWSSEKGCIRTTGGPNGMG
eukprot:scaffold35226_cov66-Phaeocystis_antarctica.AAC.4